MGTGVSVASSGALGSRAEARLPHVGLHCVNVYVRSGWSGPISGMVEEGRAIFVDAAAEEDQVRSANTGHGCRAIAVAWHGSAGMGQRCGAFSRRGRELVRAGEL